MQSEEKKPEEMGADAFQNKDGNKAVPAPSASFCSLEQLFDAITESVMVIDQDYHVRMLNRPACDRLGVEGIEPGTLRCHELLHGSPEPCFQGASLCPLGEVWKKKEPVITVHVHRDKTGLKRIMEINASPLFDTAGEVMGIITVGRDVTDRVRFEEEQKRLEERYYHQKKERSIAALAAGLAHDFNNSLTGVMGNAELLLRLVGKDNNEARFVEGILTLSHRMAGLTNQLLAYARGGKYLQTTENPATMATEVLTEVGQRFPSIRVRTRVAQETDLWQVQGDPRQLRQMLDNIITNSFEAMEATPDAALDIWLANVRMEENWECSQRHAHGPGDYVRISVTDTGKGIPISDLGQVFEPFFSTKFLGRGLGLAAALGIARNHGGCIEVTSQPQQGATVEVLLPRAMVAQEEEKRPLAPAAEATKILVVDDEPEVIWFAGELLRAEGYEVLTAENGQEALDLFLAEKDHIGIVVLDVLMPGLGGKEIYPRLKEAAPHIPVFFSSGYDEQTALTGVRLQKGDGFFKKPYRSAQLIALVKKHVRKPGGQ